MAWHLPLFMAVLALCSQSAAFAQTKPERQSKAAKPPDVNGLL